MKKYSIYYVAVEEHESLKDRFDEIVRNNNNKIDNFYYDTVKEAFLKYKPDSNRIAQVVLYEQDTSLNYPHTYRIVPKTEIFKDFPTCKVFRF